MEKNSPEKLHAIIIPYPFQGHVNPSVHLAIKLASQGITITFINTQFIHHQATKAQPDSGDDIFAGVRKTGLDIRYTTLSDGLPVGFDRSLNHDRYQSALLHVFSAHVEEVVSQIVGSGEKVNCLIADTFFVWPSKIAHKFGLLNVSFWTEATLVFSLYYHLYLLRLNGHFGCQDCREDPIHYIPGIKSIEMKDTTSYLQDFDTSSVVHQIIFKAFQDVKQADFILCNTIQEFEPDTISALQSKIPFYAIGPIFKTNCGVATSLWSESDCTQWLDKKPHGSVLYVSFGSYAHVTRKDLLEIANGLLESEVSFLWVVRPDIVSSDDVDILPDRFKEAVGDRGMVIPWCCQTTVLDHSSVGGFLTHCGWNSILESIWCEVPMLCFPLLTDQITNRKLVVDDWNIGINLSNRRSVTKEDVANNIHRLMHEKLRDVLRETISKMKSIMQSALTRDGSSRKNINQFVDDLKAKVGSSRTKS